MCDETSDSMNRSVFQIILIKLDLNADNRPKLVETVFLDDVNFETVTRSVIETLIKMEIKFEFVMAFISDNASYMVKAFKSLKPMLFNSIHVTCFAHIVSLVGETWRSNLNDMDCIVAYLKSIFARGSHRKKRFLEFLKKNGIENPILYPSPVVTRWNTWFKAVTYISENFDFILNFVNDECEIDDTIALNKLKNLFQISDIKKQFEYVSSKCNKFKYSLLKFEDQQIKSTEVYSIIFDLFNWLVGNLESEENEETFEVEFTRKLFTAAKAKLKKYIIDGAQPAMELFKNARIFDPRQARFLSKNLNDYSFPESIKTTLKDEWKLYHDICADLPIDSSDEFDIEKWWLLQKSRLPNFFSVARWYIKIPSSSCDSERALSKYKNVLDDKRQNMTEETIRINNFFYFNYNNSLFDEKEVEEDEIIIEREFVPLENDSDEEL